MRPVASSTRVYVGNLPYIAQRDDVARIFTAAGLELYDLCEARDVDMIPLTASIQGEYRHVRRPLHEPQPIVLLRRPH